MEVNSVVRFKTRVNLPVGVRVVSAMLLRQMSDRGEVQPVEIIITSEAATEETARMNGLEAIDRLTWALNPTIKIESGS